MLRIKSCCNVSLLSLLSLLLLVISGCSTQEPIADEPVAPSTPKPISILFVETPGIADEVARRWSAETGGPASSHEIGLSEFLEDPGTASESHDVIVYPSLILGELVAADLIAEVSDATWNDSELESRGLLRNNRTTLARFGGQRLAIPLSNLHYMMFIRNDTLEATSRAVPTTWKELIALASDTEVQENFEYPVAIACGEGWAAKSFIAIAAADIRQRGNLNTLFDRRTVQPLLATEPFVAALKRLKTLAGDNISLTPKQVIENYISGKAGIAIGWPHSSYISQGDGESKVYGNTTVSRLPGTERVFESDSGQWSTREGEPHRVEFTGFASTQLSVLKSANHPMDVYRFVQWLASKQTTNAIMSTAELGAPTRSAHLGNIQQWTGDVFNQETLDQYSDALLEASESPVYCAFPRIPGSTEYLAALEDAVQSFLAGDMEARDALQQAATKWEEITENLDRKNQAQMLRKDESL